MSIHDTIAPRTTAHENIEPHPAANSFPMMDQARFAELLDDIRQHGLREPITLQDGLILDGRNRYKACQELGIEPATRTHFWDPLAYVWSLNGQRRALVALAEAALACKTNR